MSEFLDENKIPEGEIPAPAPKQSRFSNTLFLTVVVIVVICSNAIAFALGMIVQQHNARPYEYVINTTNPSYEFVTEDEASVLAAQRAVNASVELRLQGPAHTVYGSGVIVGTRDLHPLILTNYHVVSRFVNGSAFAETVTPAVRLAGSPAWIENGSGERLLGLVGYESVWLESDASGKGRNDLALLELKVDVLNVADCVADWNFDPYVGERVLAVGNARGAGTAVTDGTVSKTDFSAPIAAAAAEPYARMLVHSAPINQGNSGGAVVDLNGAVVGINTSVPSAKEGEDEVRGIAYAVPAATAYGFVRRVLSYDGTAGNIARKSFYVTGDSSLRATLQPVGVTLELQPKASLVYEPSRLEVTAVTAASGDVRVGDRLLGFGRNGESRLTEAFYARENGAYSYVYRKGSRWSTALAVEEIAYRVAARRSDEAALVIRVLRGEAEIDCVFDAYTLLPISA